MKHQHNWNRSLPRSDEFHTGWACEDCSALITDDNIIVEDLDPDFPIGLIAALIILLALVICG